MKDIQSLNDYRNISINEVGVSGVKYPIQFSDGTKFQSSIGEFEFTVFLDGEKKGTHMSRFIEILEENNNISIENIKEILSNIKKRLESKQANIIVDFTYFYSIMSPITNKESKLDIECKIIGNLSSHYNINIEYKIPITTLCPCSKEISDFGAHNQRADLIINMPYIEDNFKYLVDTLVGVGSSKVYPLLKREDEKSVTEQAYSNPKFVEDVVRDAKLVMNNKGLRYNKIEVKSYESIHNHMAIARIYGDI